MTVKFDNREFFAVLPDTRKGKFDEIELFDKDGNPTGKTKMVQKMPKVISREEAPQEVARRKARHERNRKKDYIRKRASEYPDFGEFATMMFDSIHERMADSTQHVTAAEEAWYEKCRLVREKYPKPTQ